MRTHKITIGPGQGNKVVGTFYIRNRLATTIHVWVIGECHESITSDVAVSIDSPEEFKIEAYWNLGDFIPVRTKISGIVNLNIIGSALRHSIGLTVQQYWKGIQQDSDQSALEDAYFAILSLHISVLQVVGPGVLGVHLFVKIP